MGIWREHFHPTVWLRWEVLGWILGTVLAIAALLLALDQYIGANVCFVLTAFLIFTKIIHVGVATNETFLHRILFTFVLCGIVGAVIIETVRGVNRYAARKEAKVSTNQENPAHGNKSDDKEPPVISPPMSKPKLRSADPAKVFLYEPVVHIEPENELMWSTKPGQKVGQFPLTFANTGMEDIDHIQVSEDYFVALKLHTGGIIIKNLGGAPVESGVHSVLERKKSSPLLVDFSSHVEIMNEVAKNNGVPSMRGVRLTIRFRRKADGRDYRIVRGYGTIGPQAQGMFPPGIPQDRLPIELKSNFLSMSEVAPYLDLAEYWTATTHEIGQDAKGNMTSRYY